MVDFVAAHPVPWGAQRASIRPAIVPLLSCGMRQASAAVDGVISRLTAKNSGASADGAIRSISGVGNFTCYYLIMRQAGVIVLAGVSEGDVATGYAAISLLLRRIQQSVLRDPTFGCGYASLAKIGEDLAATDGVNENVQAASKSWLPKTKLSSLRIDKAINERMLEGWSNIRSRVKGSTAAVPDKGSVPPRDMTPYDSQLAHLHFAKQHVDFVEDEGVGLVIGGISGKSAIIPEDAVEDPAAIAAAAATNAQQSVFDTVAEGASSGTGGAWDRSVFDGAAASAAQQTSTTSMNRRSSRQPHLPLSLSSVVESEEGDGPQGPSSPSFAAAAIQQAANAMPQQVGHLAEVMGSFFRGGSPPKATVGSPDRLASPPERSHMTMPSYDPSAAPTEGAIEIEGDGPAPTEDTPPGGVLPAGANVAVSEDMTCVYKGMSLQNCVIEGRVKVSACMEPYVLIIRDPSGDLAGAPRANAAYLSALTGSSTQDKKAYRCQTSNANAPYVDAVLYRCGPSLRPVPARVQCRQTVSGKSVCVWVKVTPNPSFDQPLTGIVVNASLPAHGGGAPPVTNPPGDWSPERCVVSWRVPSLGKGDKLLVEARFELATAAAAALPGAVPVQFLCQSPGSLFSAVTFSLAGVGLDGLGGAAHMERERVIKRFRVNMRVDP